MTATTTKPGEGIPFASTHRTHTCGALRAADAGASVKLSGSVDRHEGDKAFALRDSYGETLVRLAGSGVQEAMAQLNTTQPALETIVTITGAVKKRAKADGGSPTGAVEVEATGFKVLSLAQKPIFDFRSDDVPAHKRIRHRYLWLKSLAAQELFRYRTLAFQAIRDHLAELAFEEIDTPILSNKWTPIVQDAFLAIRNRNDIYTLPGRFAVHGPLSLASGFDRTFEIGRRFVRKNHYGPYEQPEFDVLDVNVAFADGGDVINVVDGLIGSLAKTYAGEDVGQPIPSLTYDDAMKRYGTDTPDTRFDLELEDVSELLLGAKDEALHKAGKNRAGRALLLAGAAQQLHGEKLDALFALLGKANAYMYIVTDGPDVKPANDHHPKLGESVARGILRELGAEDEDVAVVIAARRPGAANRIAAAVRSHLGAAFGLAERKLAFVRLTELPYVSEDPSGELRLTGNPTWTPTDGGLDGTAQAMRAQASRLVLNGVYLGTEAVFNHNLDTQRQVCDVLGYTPEAIDDGFGQLFDLYKYGIPPFARAVIDVVTLLALLKGLDAIHHLIPLPKLDDGTDPLARAPWPMDRGVVRGFFGL